MELIRPDNPSRCTWKPNSDNSPHTKRAECFDRDKALPDVLTAIGQTPLIKLNNIPKLHDIKCEMFAKCEFFNPGGSVKDRIAYRMIQDAEEKGVLKPGYTIIEPTSGNTGIGLAMAAAVKGYRCIIVMPAKMSNEKVYTLRALGAEIIRTPTEAAWDSPEGHISVSQKLKREIPNSVILDQYTNAGNPLAHYDQTAVEIWKQCDGKLDYLIAGAGTGGTVSGIGRKLKELSPQTKIVAVDPKGSILAHPHDLNQDVGFYEVEGIGYDFIPTVLDRDVIDMWVKTDDCESFNAARMLIRQEGLLCGGSSGAALSVAFKIAKDLPADKRVVVLLPDGIRNYMTKFVSDQWMEARGFMEPPLPLETNKWWWNMPVSSLSLDDPPVLTKGATCQEAIHILQNSKYEVLAITNQEKHVIGVVTSDTLMSGLISGSINQTDNVEKILNKQFTEVTLSTSLGQLSHFLEKESNVVVLDDKHDYILTGIATRFHILNLLTVTDKDKISQVNGEL